MPRLDKPEKGQLWFCHDSDCPKCGFPETLTVVDEKTMKPIKRICSKDGCTWSRKFPAKAEPTSAA